jgi:arylsulfatase A-like enzyme/Flp pilus assembly protein TadD
MTLPSHANILSGRYPLDHGVRDNSGFRFPKEKETLATILKARGYRTGAFVSAFPLDSRFGLGRGFDVYDDHLGDSETSPAFHMEERRGPLTVAAAVRWLGAGEGPSFCWVHLYEPHAPYEPPEPWASRFREDLYQGEVAAADAALQPLLEPILKAGAKGRTLVVLTADHGESLGEHGEKTHGTFAYEPTLRVPLILYAPGLLSPRVAGEAVRHVDILPTILDALGLPPPPGLPGRSRLEAEAGRAPASESCYFEALSAAATRGWAPLQGVIRDGMKYIELPIPELYDLGHDPREEHNLAGSQAETRERMHALLAEMRAGDRGAEPTEESAEVRERLRSLGYTAGSGPEKGRRYTEEDDPKRLIALSTALDEVIQLYHAGQLARARSLCEDIVRRRPMPYALLQLAFLEREGGDLKGAVEAAGRALDLSPRSVDAAALLGAYLNESGHPRETVERLSPYAAVSQPDVDVLFALGAALAQVGRRGEALSTFERARTVDPSSAMALVNIGTVHLLEHDYPGARQAFESALTLEPRLSRAYNSLGVVEVQTGHPEQAIASWKKAVELNPEEYDTLFNLGDLLVREGRGSEGRSYFEAFVKRAPPALYARDLARVRGWLESGSGPGPRPARGR